MSDSRSLRLVHRALITALLLTVGLLGASSAEARPADDRSGYEELCGRHANRSASIHSRNGRWDVTVKMGRCRLDVELRGDIEFLAGESGVATMSRRARLEITEEVGRDERRLVVTPDGDGRPVYEFSIDGRSAEFDDAARSWLARTLPELFRATGIDAEARVGRILEREGVEGVLHEVTLVSGDHTQRVYLEELLGQADLDEGDLEGLFVVAGREIGSDFELAELLIRVAKTAGDFSRGFAEAVGTVGSDFEQRRVLEAVLDRRPLDPRLAAEALATAHAIGSDFEAAELLVKATRVLPRDQPLPDAFFDAVETIGSDFENRRVLDAALERRDLTPETARALLEASTSIGSDFEMAEFLIAFVREYPEGEQMPAEFERALQSVGSKYERERVLDRVER